MIKHIDNNNSEPKEEEVNKELYDKEQEEQREEQNKPLPGDCGGGNIRK